MNELKDHISNLFLDALRVSLRGQKVTWSETLSAQDWQLLFGMAQKHQVLPMIFEAVFRCPAAQEADPAVFQMYKQMTIQSVMIQTRKTGEFLRMYQYLKSRGIHPLIVKGIVCRSLYPQPDYRISNDEDLQVDADQFQACMEVLTEYGMEQADLSLDPGMDFEIPFRKKGSPIYIELHKQLFPPESDAYGDFNRYFEQMRERAVQISLDGTEILTMGCTDHLFYLICHAFKHFLHSGFGIRQVCDILLYSETYGGQVDWQEILEKCREIRADRFTAALFRIGTDYLAFDKEKAGLPDSWKQIEVDALPLLLELLDAGVFGDGSMSRRHSSTMTLNAFAAQKKGKKSRVNVVKTVFPPAKELSGSYSYLKDRPYLLPAAWVQRILKYRKEQKAGGDNSAAESIRIGEQRVNLFKYYGILESKDKEKRKK